MRYTLLILLSVLPAIATSQVTLRGIAVRINSSFTPVPGVEIVMEGASPAVSDGAGAFTVHIPHTEPGDLLFDIQIRKQGMVVVNQKEVEEWTASSDILYKIVLCEPQYLEDQQRKFYNIGKNFYQKEYEKKLKELQKELTEQNLSKSLFEQEISVLNLEFQKRMHLLDIYSSKFARINKDELSAMEKEAIEQVEQGNIDKAISIYQSSGVVEEFKKKVTTRDSLNYAMEVTDRLMRQQIKWYYQEGSKSSLQKAAHLDSLLRSNNKRIKP